MGNIDKNASRQLNLSGKETTFVIAIPDVIKLARPKHWVKNVIVFLPVVFGKQIGIPTAWLQVGIAATAFSFVSSAVYVVNDIKDRYMDREHPVKKNRPLASGRMTPRVAIAEAVVLLVVALVISLGANLLVLFAVVSYFLLQLAYTFYLKQKMIIDVICIALGFVLRAAAGALAIRVEVSPWLMVCTFTICLFMGFCKRRNEIATIEGFEVKAPPRRILVRYTPELLTHLVTLSAGVATVSYMLYATSPRTIENCGTDYFVYTLPLVLYGIFRFAMLSMEARYSDPTELILNDRPFQMAVVLWVVCAVLLMSWGKTLQSWLAIWY